MVQNLLNAIAHEERIELLDELNEKGEINLENHIDNERKKINYYHNHIPLLDNYDYIEFDEINNIILDGELTEDILPLVEFIKDNYE